VTRPPTPIKPVVYGYRDLMRVTGLGRDTVKAAIRSGELPGYLVGRTYVVPAEAFEAFCRGAWTPQPRPVLAHPARAIVVTRHERTA
jgi:excisionase family DNA binding protein